MLIISTCLLIFIQFNLISCLKTKSLTFVIDDTRSMEFNIEQVKNNADAIMDIVLNEKSCEIKEIVLVTFNDPEVKLRIKTTSREEFNSALSSIKAGNYFNYDCPEMSLTGVKLGLEESLPGSYIYVLTDATAKDYRKVDSIKILCEKTQSQVVFILTGDCNRPNSRGYKVYHEIAAASNGHVFRVKRNEVDSVLKTIQETIRGRQRLLTRKSIPPNVPTEVPFTVDDNTEYVIIAASGTDVVLDITGPSTNMEKIMWTRNGKVVKISDPAPGNYVALVSGNSPTSVAVHAKTDFSFQYGFSKVVPISLADTSLRPVAGIQNYLALSISDPNNEIKVESAQILDANENVITEVPLKKVSDNFYITSPFVASNAMFKIAVQGKTKEGTPVRRISKTSFLPEPPTTVPEVTIIEGARSDLEYGSSLLLTCRVTAYPKPVIVWKDNEDNLLPTNAPVVEPPYHISYLQLSAVTISKKYSCQASNSVGKDTKVIDVTVADPFKVISAPPETLNIKQGETAKIRCDITSKLPMQITWYHVDEFGAKTRLMPSKAYTISRDETELVIKAVDSTLAGQYICKALLLSNDGINKQFTFNIKLPESVAPVIDKTTTVIEIQEMESITIPCKILQGVPAPVLTWQYRFSKLLPFETTNLLDKEITQQGFEGTTIFKAELKKSGEYKCIAENSAGSDEHVTALVVLKKPEITINEGAKLSVNYGSSVSATCTVSANPEPSIEWKDVIGDVVTAGSINYLEDFKYSKTLRINNVKESNKYYCLSQNKQGQAAGMVEVTVLSPFKVNSYPGEFTNAVYGSPTKIKCDITSNLPMIITWIYINNKTKLKEIIRMSAKYTISSDETELIINTIDVDSVGEYTCRASLLFDDEESKSFTTEVKLQGIMTPKILDQNASNIQVEENLPALIQCKVANVNPKPTIRWEFRAHSGHEFLPIPQVGEEMHIPSAVMHNAGYYRCIAENVIGNEDKITELVVTKKPVIVILEGFNTSVSYGNQLVLTCRVMAYPDPKVTWTDSSGSPVNSEILKTTDEYEYTSVLNIPNVKKPGKYYCLAENVQGKSSAHIDVTVLLPFKVVTHPEPITIAEYGKPVTITCDIRSHLITTIIWQRFNDKTRENEIIKPSNKYSFSWDQTRLTINNVDNDSIGKYSCKASLASDKDQFTSFNTDVRIKQLLYPKLDKNITVVEVQENTQASIVCPVLEGIPAPKITWQFKFRGSNQFLTIPSMGESMQIPNAVLNNAGYYKCIAENVAGSDDKITELIVKKAPSVTILEGTKINSIYGSEISITCKVIAYPDPSITWYDERGTIFPAETLPATNEYEYTSLLKIPNFKKSARFYCRAVNSIEESSAYTDVTVPSLFSVDPEVTMNVEYGKSITIQCGVKSQMPIVITWNHVNAITKETEIVRASEKYSMPWDGTKLTIRFMNSDLVGKYSCKASLLFDIEQYAIHDTNVDIDGLTPPKFNKTYSSIEVTDNLPVTIECELLEGTPKPKISWQFKSRGSRNFLPIPGFEDYLRIPIVVLNSAGYYRCIAENSAGHDDKITELIVVKTPLVIIVEGKKVTLPYGAELTLTCKVIANPTPTIVWSSDEDLILTSEISPDSSDYEYISRLKIVSVKKSLKYYCKAENSQGIVTESIEVTTEPIFQVQQQPKVPAAGHTTDIHNIDLLVGETRQIKCLVPHINTDYIKWYMNGKDTMVTQPSLTLNDVDISMDANYTCQVTSNQGSHSDTYIVKVGYLPVFINDLVTTNINWKGSGYLDCKVKAKPEAKVLWTHNGVPLDISTDIFDLKISGRGQYICKASNVHGSVTRRFNVTTNGCLINRNTEVNANTPLLMSSSFTFPLFETVDEYLVIEKGFFFTLSCHNGAKANSFLKFPGEYDLMVTCNIADTFWVNGQLYKYSDFHCNNKILPVVIEAENKCLGDNTELLKVGFNVKDFIEIYQVCLDMEKVVPLYTRLIMRHRNSKFDTEAFKWFQDTEIGFTKVNQEYSCENGLSTMCYARTQLVSVYDVPFGPAQTSTFIDHLNAVPLWKPGKDTYRMTWQEVEDNIRVRLNVNKEITVWSGASGYTDKGGSYIPRFLWKVVMSDESDTTVIIYVNDPAPTYADIRCRNTCDGSSPFWFQSNDKFTYCCTFEEFLAAFKLPETMVMGTSQTQIDLRMNSWV